MNSDHVFMDNSSMSDVVSGLQGHAARAQARLDQITNLHAQLVNTSQGNYAASGDEIVNQAKAYFGHVVDHSQNLATQVPNAISGINGGDNHASTLFQGAIG